MSPAGPGASMSSPARCAVNVFTIMLSPANMRPMLPSTPPLRPALSAMPGSMVAIAEGSLKIFWPSSRRTRSIAKSGRSSISKSIG